MAERGEYRSISRALLAGKDFRKLPARVRWVFVVLKINANAAGIETWYEAELHSRLTEESGLSIDHVRSALDQLAETGWLKREDNVLWIVGHLTNDPHFKSANANHRRGVQRTLAGMPRLAIVKAFYEAHPDWFPEKECKKMGLEWVLKPIRRASRTHRDTRNESRSGLPMGSESHRDQEKEEDKEKDTALGSVEPIVGKSWPDQAAAIWSEQVSPIDTGRVGKALKAIVDKYGWQDTRNGLTAYLECSGDKVRKLEWFAGDAVRWIERIGKMPLNDEHGLTERGRMIEAVARKTA